MPADAGGGGGSDLDSQLERHVDASLKTYPLKIKQAKNGACLQPEYYLKNEWSDTRFSRAGGSHVLCRKELMGTIADSPLTSFRTAVINQHFLPTRWPHLVTLKRLSSSVLNV